GLLLRDSAAATIFSLSLHDALPICQLQALAGPIASGVRSFTQDRVAQVVSSDVFAQAWEQANRSAHEQLVAALTGQSSSVSVSRSEEHTSELQSPDHLVCRLLLEKK